MLRRYLLPCALIMLVAVGTAGLAYVGAAANKTYSADCTFRALIQIGGGPPLTADAVNQFNTAANIELLIAKDHGVYEAVAAKVKRKPADIAGGTIPGLLKTGLATFDVDYTDSDPKSAATIANALCDQFVTVIQQQRTSEVQANIKFVEDRLTGIVAEERRLARIPKSRRTSADLASIVAQAAAQKENVQLLASMLGAPPDDIKVLTHATGATRNQHRSLSKNLVIGLLGGLLASFLVVLVGETISEARKSPSY